MKLVVFPGILSPHYSEEAYCSIGSLSWLLSMSSPFQTFAIWGNYSGEEEVTFLLRENALCTGSKLKELEAW